jgi:DNA polymerase I-like protein with 3'-5' exonuclease and polymerase domains
MKRCVWDMKTKGYVTSRAGRKKRGKMVYELYNKYKVKDYSKRSLEQVFSRLPEDCGVKDGLSLYLECRNTFNVAKNHCIQSLAASIMNVALIDVQRAVIAQGLKAKLVATVHDEAILICPVEEAETVANILQKAMESNRISKTMRVPLLAEPVITEKSLAEAK